MKLTRSQILLIIWLLLCSDAPFALRHSHCPLPTLMQANALSPLPFNQLNITADRAFVNNRQWFQLDGQVTLQQNTYYLATESASFNLQSKQLFAYGDILYQQENLLVHGERARLNLLDKTGTIDIAQYHYPSIDARGHARQLFLSPDVAKFTEASYTTCENTHPFWQIQAESITLDKVNNTATATNLSLRIKHLPILYLPYFSFPLQGRKSGFLVPDLVLTTNQKSIIAMPYYLNLAPNRDLTIIPRWFETRGYQAGAELRYLSTDSDGNVAGEYLYNDQQTRQNRYHVHWQHSMQLLDYGSLQTNITHVSDIDYFRNFGNTLSNTSQSILERKITTRLAYRNTTFSGILQDFQQLEQNAAKPYKRLPQFTVTSFAQWGGIDFDFYSQFTHFEHEELLDGQRLIAEPTITWPYNRAAGFFKPTVLLRYAKYRTGRTQATRILPGIFIPRYALDTGLFFERFLTQKTQTLEPRLHLMYTPVRSQNNLPQFDSARKEMNFRQLFDTRLYSGEDRIADMSRITLGLTSRLISHRTGQEQFKIALASSYYLRPQQTTLVNETPIQQRQLQSAANIASQLTPHLRADVNLFWDRVDVNDNKLLIQLNHEKQSNILNFSYHYRQNQVKQFSVSALWKLATHWRLASHWNYSLRNRRTQENTFGVEYNACCWSIGLLYRELNRGIDAENDISFAIQFELKGLTNFGQSLSQRFNRDVLGYTQEN